MKVADVMRRDVEPISADFTVQEAALKMATDDVGAVLVGTHEALQGILTDRDIILRAVVDGRDTASLRVRDVMSSTLFTCREEDALEVAVDKMSEHQIRRLPVLGEQGRLTGMVTLGDLGRLEQVSPRRAETGPPTATATGDPATETPRAEASE